MRLCHVSEFIDISRTAGGLIGCWRTLGHKIPILTTQINCTGICVNSSPTGIFFKKKLLPAKNLHQTTQITHTKKKKSKSPSLPSHSLTSLLLSHPPTHQHLCSIIFSSHFLLFRSYQFPVGPTVIDVIFGIVPNFPFYHSRFPSTHNHLTEK